MLPCRLGVNASSLIREAILILDTVDGGYGEVNPGIDRIPRITLIRFEKARHHSSALELIVSAQAL